MTARKERDGSGKPKSNLGLVVKVHNFLTFFYLPLTQLGMRLGMLSSISRSALRRPK
jgi:hypothetical protein